MMNKLEKMIKFLRRDYVILEMWSEHFEGRDLKEYAQSVASRLAENESGVELLLMHRSRYIEQCSNPFICFDGYRLFVHSSMFMPLLKERWAALELDETGRRVADIDVYDKNYRKVSRYCPERFLA